MLRTFAQRLVRLSHSTAQTPVLVLPRYVSLRPAFYVNLFHAIRDCSDVEIRFDRLSDCSGFWSPIGIYLARIRINRIVDRLPAGSSMQITSTIGKPGRDEMIVLGIANDDQPLPSWTIPVSLACVP